MSEKQHFCPVCKKNVPMNTWSGHLLDKHLEALIPSIKEEQK